MLNIWLPPVQSWSVVFPGPDSRLAFFSVLSVFRREVIHLLSQVGQLDQTLLQVLLQLGHLQLQGQDSLTKHTNTVLSQTDFGWQDNMLVCVSKCAQDLLQEQDCSGLLLCSASMPVLSPGSDLWWCRWVWALPLEPVCSAMKWKENLKRYRLVIRTV